jgi:hypothetical protein
VRILFIGDIFGTLGKRILAERLSSLRTELRVDVCIVNGENAAGGHGITHRIVNKLKRHGADIITGGNHSFANQEGIKDLKEDPLVLRPHNYPDGNVGTGVALYTLPDARTVGVISLQGRTYAPEQLLCPFRTADAAVSQLSASTRVIFVDFHAEATSEKKALFFYLDGRISALVGTHTHVQTADEIISAQGTAYISDAGMTGPEGSCIGMKQESVIRKFLLQTPVRFEPSVSGPMLNGVFIEVDDETGKATQIRRIYERIALGASSADEKE